MKKVLSAAVVALALVGCGGPLEDDGTDATGAQRQEVLDAPVPPRADAPKVNKDLIKNPQELVVRAPAFQEQMHLNNPIHSGGCN